MREIDASYRAAVKQEQLGRPNGTRRSSSCWRRMRRLAVAIELVLAQPAISSQLIDNLNASMHLRALLTDLFLIIYMYLNVNYI